MAAGAALHTGPAPRVQRQERGRRVAGPPGAIGAGPCAVGGLLACACSGGQRPFHNAQGPGDHRGSAPLPVRQLLFEVGHAQPPLWGPASGRERRGDRDGLSP